MPAGRRTAAFLVAGLVWAVSIEPAGAWNERGHMLVAFIAFRHLDADVKTEVGRLLRLNPQFKSWVENLPPSATEERRTETAFVRASRWPDDIKGFSKYIDDGDQGGNVPPPGPAASQNIGYADLNRHKYWHFKNVPFTDDGTKTREPPAVNAQSEIEIMRAALASSATPDDIKSYDLVWLIHLVGDVHQPLHATARFTKPLPDGDRGGNLQLLENCAQWLGCQANLHAQWDRLLGVNMTASSVSSTGVALDTKLNPPGSTSTDVNEWIAESVALAKEQAYRTSADTRLPSPKAFLTLAYVERARLSAQTRAVLAGRRLAKLLNDAL